MAQRGVGSPCRSSTVLVLIFRVETCKQAGDVLPAALDVEVATPEGDCEQICLPKSGDALG